MKPIALVLMLGGATVAGLGLGELAAPAGRHAVAGTAAPGGVDSVMAGPSLAVLPSLSASAASASASAETKAKATAATRMLAWDELVPKDWDPLKKFRDMNLDALSDSDPRAIELLKRMRESWDNAPTNREVDGAKVRIAGYIVPLDEGKAGLLRFLLVPYYGACIHTPPPPSNQIIDVTPQTAVKFRLMAPVWVSGTLHAQHSDTVLGSSGYQLSAESVEWYTPGLDHGLHGLK